VLGLSIKHLPDLIILDMDTSQIDGYLTLEKIKQDKRLDGIPVIAISELPFASHIANSIGYSFDEYLAKPLDLEQLLTVIKLLTSQSAAGSRNSDI